MYPYKSNERHDLEKFLKKTHEIQSCVSEGEFEDKYEDFQENDIDIQRRHHHESPIIGKPPTSRPPDFIPSKHPGLRAVDPAGIARCVGNMTYIWFRDGKSNWIYLTHVGKNSASGYTWTKHGWVYTGFSLRIVESFSCFG